MRINESEFGGDRMNNCQSIKKENFMPEKRSIEDIWITNFLPQITTVQKIIFKQLMNMSGEWEKEKNKLSIAYGRTGKVIIFDEFIKETVDYKRNPLDIFRHTNDDMIFWIYVDTFYGWRTYIPINDGPYLFVGYDRNTRFTNADISTIHEDLIRTEKFRRFCYDHTSLVKTFLVPNRNGFTARNMFPHRSKDSDPNPPRGWTDPYIYFSC